MFAFKSRKSFSAALATVCLLTFSSASADEVANSFRVTPYVQHPATNAVSLLWLAATNGNATVDYWVMGSATTNTIASATEIQPSDRVSNSRFTADGVLQYCLAPEFGYALSPEPGDNYPSYTREGVGATWSMPYTVPYQYRVRLTGLAPDTEYGYRVTLVGGAKYERTFHTAPMAWRGIRFTLYSDSETEPADNPYPGGCTSDWPSPVTGAKAKYYVTQTEAYASNVAAVVAFKPDLILMAGDLAQKGSRQNDWDEFWRHNAGPLNDPAGSVPILASPGNHDYYSYEDGGEVAMSKYLSYFEYEPNGSAVDSDQQERFHRVDYGPATFIFMDANNGDDAHEDLSHDTNCYFAKDEEGFRQWYGSGKGIGCRAPEFNAGSAQYQWVEAQLKDAQKKSAFIFVVSHQCPYSVGDHGQPNVNGGEILSGRPLRIYEEMFHKYGVTAWLCGHDEMMERSVVTGTETRPDGTTRAHTLQIWDMGIAGDGLRGDKKIDNPQEQFRAAANSTAVFDENGLHIDGGVHYGHLQVTITNRADGAWVATFDPVYEFFSTNALGQTVYGGTRHYDDLLSVVNTNLNPTPPPAPVVPEGIANYIKKGLVGHWDGEYNSTNAQGVACHDSTPGIDWIDLSGQGQHAKAVASNGVYPQWGANYMNPSNSVGSKSTTSAKYTFTPSADGLAAANCDNGGFTYSACIQVNKIYGDMSYFGFTGGASTGQRCDYRGSSSPYFFKVRGGTESTIGSVSRWLQGIVDTGVWGHGYFSLSQIGGVTSADDYWRGSYSLGTSRITGGGFLGSCYYSGNNSGDYKLHAVRLYDRPLTRVEQAYNAEIDKVRFLGWDPRATLNYGASSSTNEDCGVSTPAYNGLTAVAPGTAKTFSIAGVAPHVFDQRPAYVKSGRPLVRHLYHGVDITAIAANGVETTTHYADTVTNVDVTVDKDVFAVWQWERQNAIVAIAARGGTLRINDSETTVAGYTNWHNAYPRTVVTVTAVPDNGWTFSGWTGDISGLPSETTQTLTLDNGRSIAAAFVRSGEGTGETYHWKGGYSSVWFDSDNWVEGLAPLAKDHVVIPAGSADQTILLAKPTPRYASVTIGGGAKKTTIQMQNWDTVLNADVVVITNNATLAPYSTFKDTEMSNRVYVACRDFTLYAGGTINANGLGYARSESGSVAGYGPGRGRGDRGGAGHGGQGGHGYGTNYNGNNKDGAIYDSVEAPEMAGSSGGGGGYGQPGGGVVRIAATGAVKLWGIVTANGVTGGSAEGSGAGGAVYVSCSTFEGTNVISVLGGRATGATGGGGGGGRIAIVYDTAAQANVSVKPTPIFWAGARHFGIDSRPERNTHYHVTTVRACMGQEGTVYLPDSSFYPGTIWWKSSGRFIVPGATSLVVDAISIPAESTTKNETSGYDVFLTGMDVTVAGNLDLGSKSRLQFSNCTVRVGGNINVAGGTLETYGYNKLAVAGDFNLTGASAAQIHAGRTNGVDAATWNQYGTLVEVGGKLKLADTAVLYPRSECVKGGSPFFRLGALEVGASAKIDGFGRGWGGYATITPDNQAGRGPGGFSYSQTGAAHGGRGGGPSTNNKLYGDEKYPTDPGSSGGRSWGGYVGGYGGGLFWAEIAGRAVVNGSIEMTASDPISAETGGGSGGAVNLSCKGLSGTGTISAKGGAGGSNTGWSGCGGGGRVAVRCTSTNNWSGAMSAAAGTNSYTYTYCAQPGTVYVKITGGLQILLR